MIVGDVPRRRATVVAGLPPIIDIPGYKRYAAPKSALIVFADDAI
jgi:hypothetical protein